MRQEEEYSIAALFQHFTRLRAYCSSC